MYFMQNSYLNTPNLNRILENQSISIYYAPSHFRVFVKKANCPPYKTPIQLGTWENPHGEGILDLLWF